MSRVRQGEETALRGIFLGKQVKCTECDGGKRNSLSVSGREFASLR